MNLENEGKINLLVTFLQRFLTQCKLSLIFTKTLYFYIKYDALKNADDPKFHITKLNPWKLTCRKQPITARDEIEVNVILATKYKVSFLLYIVYCISSTFSIFILISFLFKQFSKASKEQVTINKWYIKLNILVSRRYSAASNFRETSGGKM